MLSGKREAELSALGVVSGFHRPDGIVGDLGGGSLELTDVHGHRVEPGVTLPLGGLALQDVSAKSIKKAEKIVRKALGDAELLKAGARPHLLRHRRHLARARAAAHVADRLSAARDARLRHPGQARRYEFSGLVHRVNAETLSQIEVVADARRPLLAYAALVLEHLVRDRAAEGRRDLGARRARGPALFDARRRRAAQGPADRGRATSSTCCARARPRMARS